MSNLRDLLSKANRKYEMRWKVLVFDPKKDNELVDEFKDFECIDCATAKKRELLEKHPDKTIEIIAESIGRKTEAGKEIKVGNQRFYTTNDNGIIFVRKIAPYDDADYYYAVYDPQKVRLVFTQSGGKNKQASMVKYNDTAKQIEEIAKKLIELNKYIQPKMVHESAQKNEGKVNMSKLKNEIQAAVNKYFKDDKDLLEYVHIETKKDKFGRDVLEVRAELGYNSMVKLADYLDKIVTKYDKYAYFDQETSGIMTAVFESAQKNEALTNKEIAEVFRANGFKMVYVDANHVSGKKGNTKVWTYMDEKTLSTSDEPYTKGNYPQGFRKDPHYAQINAKLPTSKEELDKLLKSVKIESAQKNEDEDFWHYSWANKLKDKVKIKSLIQTIKKDIQDAKADKNRELAQELTQDLAKAKALLSTVESAQKNEAKHSKDFTKNIYTTLEKVSKAILKVTDSDYRKSQQTLGYAAICLAALQNYVNHVGQSTDEWLADHPTEADKYYKQAIDAANRL